MPEYDMPGHTGGFIQGFNYLQGSGQCCFDPTLNSTYQFVAQFLAEVVKVFPENYIHLGGDEVDFQCWNSTAINTWMVQNNIASYTALENYFEDKVLAMAAALNKSVMVWQDPFNNGVVFAPDTVIEVWKGQDFTTLTEVLAAGYRAVLSGGWYLDSYATTWDQFYTEDINQDYNITEQYQKLVMGGEVCMWGEWINDENFHIQVWPRGTAVAEVFWSPFSYPKIPNFAAQRIFSWSCLMNLRGIPAAPIHTNPLQSFCNPR